MSFYVTTPIYYVNDQPHIGHAYTTVAADVLARYHRMRGEKVYFQTGTDEHGQKVQEAADARGLQPKAHADAMVENFKALWAALDISHDAFIRTTDPEHKQIVQGLLQKLWDEGKIVKRKYSGWYCTPDERFWTEKDLSDGNCPDCGREVEHIEEENYFFLMSQYRDRLVQHIEADAAYILPETRRNEVLGFLKHQELGDLCISRPTSRLSWGVPLPFDEDFVTYVWFDALVNYYSGTGYLGKDEAFWPATHHLIGKDILTTHAVYWSTMLMALGLPLPLNIFAHGWWTVEGRKMSKSLGNVVDPAGISAKYGADAFRYFLLREVPFGLDGDFSLAALIGRVNTDLANDLGNLHSRVLKMVSRYFKSEIPTPETEHAELKALAEGVLGEMEEHLKYLRFNRAIDEIWKLVSYSNKYIDTSAPWALAKDPTKRGELASVLYSCAEALRFLALYLHPLMPEATTRLWRSLGLSGGPGDGVLMDSARWGGLKPGAKIIVEGPLFPRIDDAKPGAKANEAKHANKQKKGGEAKVPENAQDNQQDNLIDIKDFAKVELKIGLVREAEAVEGSNKLLKVKVDVGEAEDRQVVAGIAGAYGAGDLVGRHVVVVTNLKPAKLMGVESEGMLLAATDAEGIPIVLMPERDVAPGARVK